MRIIIRAGLLAVTVVRLYHANLWWPYTVENLSSIFVYINYYTIEVHLRKHIICCCFYFGLRERGDCMAFIFHIIYTSFNNCHLFVKCSTVSVIIQKSDKVLALKNNLVFNYFHRQYLSVHNLHNQFIYSLQYFCKSHRYLLNI